MSDAFLSSDDFDEQAHQLYNEGRYDEALTVLKEGITLYPNAVELHIGKGYAHLAREEFAWSRRSFETALSIDPDHEGDVARVAKASCSGRRKAARRRPRSATRSSRRRARTIRSHPAPIPPCSGS